MTAMTRLTQLAEQLGRVPHLGEGVPPTVPNLVQRVLKGGVLTPAQQAYTLQLLLVVAIDLLDAPPEAGLRQHADPLFLRIAHGDASARPATDTNPMTEPPSHDEARNVHDGQGGNLSNPFRHDPSESSALHSSEPSTGPAGANTQATPSTGAGPGDGTQQPPPIPNPDTVCS